MTFGSKWIRITETTNIPPREGRCVTVAGKEIAIFNLNGRFHAVDNACPHRGGPLCDGIVTGTRVVCPLHGRHFDLVSGLPVRAAEATALTVYPVHVEDGIICLNPDGIRQAAA